MSTRRTTLEAALLCAKCGTKALYVEEIEEHNCHGGQPIAPGELVLVTCPNRFCKERPSFFCKSCSVKCYRNSLKVHLARKKHIENHGRAYPTPLSGPIQAPSNTTGNPSTAQPSLPGHDLFNDITFLEDGNNLTVTDSDAEDIYNDAIENDLGMTHVENGESPMEISTPEAPSGDDNKSTFPKISMKGNEWLANLLKNKKRATIQEMFAAFEGPHLEHMKNFWAAEQGSGEGRCGGCLIYMSAKTFQQVRDGQMDSTRYPCLQEALWQFHNFLQYQSMNKKQRKRQSLINLALTRNVPSNSFFKDTFLPPYNQLGRYYGTTGQHSMYNSLPRPKAIDVNGVAYVSPRAIIAFVLAFGIPIDDFFVTADPPDLTSLEHTVHNVEDCQKALDWARKVHEQYFSSKNGAPDLNFGAPTYEAIVCIVLSDWCDGFDSAKVKSNRNPIVSKTFTVSPPKHLVNSTENTFVVALGLKKARGWLQVEERFRADVEELTRSEKPILFYHGVLQKLVPCVFKRFAVLSDKQERNGLTGTIGCGSNLHRCFGIVGNIETPSCMIPELQQFLKQESNGKSKPSYGWTADYVENNRNGAFLPSCPQCRRDNLTGLLQHTKVNTSRCKDCRDWDFLGKRAAGPIQFTAHKDWPSFCVEGSPVDPPKGRDVFQEKVVLPHIKLTWDLMKQACKFAFYQASRKRGCWNKASTVQYLKHCGIANGLSAELYSAARSCSKANLQDSVDYGCSDRIGNFKFHPSWLSHEIEVRDYIEALMHQLFLGAASSNFELLELWMKETPSSAKLGFTTFLNVLQDLIKDLRGFNLSWLNAYPLTGKKGSLGTGSWVAENWVFFTRISQFVTAWCVRDHSTSSRHGVDDVSRLVIAFHAFVARCLTHGGMNKESIAEAHLYMKEVLSCLRELDVRVRYEKLNKTAKKVSDRKGTEAWWLKPNYMSLPNLILMMAVLGPLVLWWDGGGKGERYIQEIKPHIKKGIRFDATSFFVHLLEKLFSSRILELLERRFNIGGDTEDDEEEDIPVLELLNELAECTLGGEKESDSLFGDTVATSDDEDSDEDDDETDRVQEEEHGAYLSKNEAHGMTKTKTIYVYRNEKQLMDSIAAGKPIAGIVEVAGYDKDGAPKFEFNVVYRKPVKQFAKRGLVFDDATGVNCHGLWCAQIQIEDEKQPTTSSFDDIQTSAQLAAVAIPMSYAVGKNSPIGDKYCVITNWWKYRFPDGSYQLPRLDPTLYGDTEFQTALQEQASMRAGNSRKGVQVGKI